MSLCVVMSIFEVCHVMMAVIMIMVTVAVMIMMVTVALMGNNREGKEVRSQEKEY